MSVPMRIRIRWSGTAWWAYFNGWPTSYLFAERLPDLCNLIRTAFPAGTMAAADYDLT